MKLLKKTKKGFTLVELIVVIAIVAILAAVSVVSYIAFINQANESADIQLVKQLNVALQADEALNGHRDTMYDMLGAMEDNGFVVENLTKTKSGYDIVWDKEHNRFGLLNGENLVFGEKSFVISEHNKFNFWKFADTEAEASNQLYSVYLTEEFAKTHVNTLNIKAGLDTGIYSAVTSVNYTNKNENPSLINPQHVIIRTSSQITDVTVDAPKDEVDHYGVAKTVNVQAVKMGTYTEYGCVSTIKLVTGKVDIQDESIVGTLDLTEAANDAEQAAVANSGTVFNVKGGENTQIHVTPKAKGDVIEVASADALINIASAQNQGMLIGAALNIEITDNIDLTGRAWTPFGNSYDPSNIVFDAAFQGSIDGKGHSIVGLSTNRYVGGKTFSIVASNDSNASPFALITYACGNVTIKNLTIEAEISGNWKGASAFIAVYDDQYSRSLNTTHNVHFENCIAKGSMTAKEKVAGFLGSSYISGNSTYARNKGPRVTFLGCRNEATVTGTDTTDCRIGGFVGTLQASDAEILEHSTFTNCVNAGAVNGEKAKTSGEFVGATGSGSQQTISFVNCSAISNEFVGCLNYATNPGETIVNPENNSNVTIDLRCGYSL